MTTSPSRLSKTIREALAMILSQPVVSVLTLALIAGMSATVVLTSGRTAAAERDLLAKIDEASSRAVVVRAEPKAGLGYDVVDKLSRVQDVEWVGAFGPARDATNGTTGSDVAVAVRSLVATSLEPWDSQQTPSPSAATQRRRRSTCSECRTPAATSPPETEKPAQ